MMTLKKEQSLHEMRIPFEVSVDPFYSPANQQVLEESIRQLESGKGKKHDLIEVG